MILNKKIICRICNSKIKKKPILTLKNMPIAAQHFLKKDQIKKKDKSLKLNIWQCDTCGLVQLNTKPVSYFKSVITAASISGDAKKSKIKQLSNFKKKFKLKNKKIIEIGCGTGAVLDLIKINEMKAYGLEYSKKSVSEGRLKKRKIIRGYLGDINMIKHGPYDGFICYNFLEHIPNINSFIEKISNNLTPEGVGLVTVPNLNYLIKTRSFYEFVPDHLSYFTIQTLKNLFKSHNYKIIESNLINNENDILLLVKRKRHLKKTIFNKPKKLLDIKKKYVEVTRLINKLTKIKNNYISNKKKIAVWGAGHRTLALLAISKFKEIEYIIDSAKFKQGLYSPINFTKIVPPETLKSEHVDLLIIMLPGIYPDEVIKLVKKMKISNMKIAKLINNKVVFC